MSAQDELGPVLPPRGEIYAIAAELLALARLAVEFSCAGAHSDLPRAVKKLNEARALLGGTDG